MERGKWRGGRGAVPSTDTQIKPTAAQDIRVVEYLNVEQRIVERGEDAASATLMRRITR